MLQLWAYFDYRDLWYTLFLSVFNEEVLPAEFLPDWFTRVFHNETCFVKAAEVLLSYSLIEIKSRTSSYSVHPVVHAWCFHTMQNEKTATAVLAISIVGSTAPSLLKDVHWSSRSRILPHCERALVWMYAASPSLFESDSRVLIWSQAFYCIGLIFFSYSIKGEAEKSFLRALDGYKRLWGPDNRFKFYNTAMTRLGQVYFAQGKHEEAEKTLLRALNGHKACNCDPALTYLTIRSLGSLYMDQNKLDEAEEMYLQALNGYLKT
jgi:tetratricopeptide (TPR) repeat protein